MTLNSLRFAAFFLIFLIILAVLPKKLRKVWLLIGNSLFYLSRERGYFFLLILSALMVWYSGSRVGNTGSGGLPSSGEREQKSETEKRKKLFLILPVVWNIGLLVFFKYTGLISGLFRKSGIVLSFQDLLAPLGISFYTLRCISYVTEVYRGNLPAMRDPFDVFIYVSFFPQIISGPIERPGNFFRQLDAFRTKNLLDFERLWHGFLLFVWGLFQKIVIAERLSVITTHIFGSFREYGFWELLIASIAYTLQIYCDFGGYSDMSRGAAMMIGFPAMRNFRQPYLAAGIRNFWRRWHISLTDWLTEYVYIPLGGSRKGVLRKYVNIIAVFLVSGLWHGSTLNFIFWGMLHAAYRIMEDLWERSIVRDRSKLSRRSIFSSPFALCLSRFITLAEVNFAWIFFNAGGLNRGFRIIRQMFSRFAFPAVWNLGLVPGNMIVLGCGLILLALTDVLHEKGISIQQKTAALPLPVRWAVFLVLFWSVILLGIYGIGYDTSGFIYAQF